MISRQLLSAPALILRVGLLEKQSMKVKAAAPLILRVRLLESPEEVGLVPGRGSDPRPLTVECGHVSEPVPSGHLQAGAVTHTCAASVRMIGTEELLVISFIS